MGGLKDNPNAQGGAMLIAGALMAATPMGWAGWLVAGVLGMYLFPPKYEKPDAYTSLGLNSAQTGISIPLVYGTVMLGGNWVWRGALGRKAIRQSSGMSGGKKQTVGYKYYANAAMGICEGPAEITRMWSDGDRICFEGNSAIRVYGGETDQLVDPLISASVTNPVPFRGLCYVAFARYPIGQSNTAPNFVSESHSYPYHEDAGKFPFTKERQAQSVDTGASGPVHGMTLRDDIGRYIIVNRTTVEIWDKRLETKIKTITIPSQYGIRYASDERAWDVDLIHSPNGARMLYFGYEAASTLRPRVGWMNIDSSQRKIAIAAHLSYVELGTYATNYVYITHNSQYCFAMYGTQVLKKFAWNDYSTLLGTYSIPSPLPNCIPICASEEFLFGHERGDGYVYTFSFTGAIIDRLGTFRGNNVICRPYGSNCLLLHYEGQSGDPFFPEYFDTWKMFFYDRNTGELTEGEGEMPDNNSYDGNRFWESGETVHIGYLGSGNRKYDKLWAGKDGTVTLSMLNTAPNPDLGAILCLKLDANPSQVIYHAMTVVREMDLSRIDLPSLSDMGDYCFENFIGVSIPLNAEMELREFLTTIMSYVGGIIYPTNDGKQAFKVFRTTDASVADITEDDIVAGEYDKYSVNLRDRITVPNRIVVQYVDRSNDYADGSFQCDHFLSQEEDGDIMETDVDLRWLSDARSASRQGYRMMKLAQYDTKIVGVKLMPKHLSRSVGEIVTAKFAGDTGLTNQRLRIVSLTEPDMHGEGGMDIIARVEEDYFNTLETYDVTASAKQDTSYEPANDVRPVAWEPGALQTGDEMRVRLTCIRQDDNVAGCRIFISFDNVNFQDVGVLYNPALTADVETAITQTAKTIVVDSNNYPDAFSAVTVEEQRNDYSFCLVGLLVDGDLALDNMEFVNYREAVDAAGIVTMKNCYRGVYYTVPKAHTTSEVLLLVGRENFIDIPIQSTDVGKTVYVKCVAFNARGEEQEFEDVELFEYLITGNTKRSTHASGLQLTDGGSLFYGSARTTPWGGSPEKIYISFWRTNRIGGIDRIAIGQWAWNSYIAGDDDKWELLVYNTSKVLVATHDVTSQVTTGGQETVSYSKTDNVADFGSETKHFWLGLRPKNAIGYLTDDVEMIEVYIL